MPAMHDCQLVDVGFVDTARHRYANSVDLAITPEQLFEVLEDADAWPRWAKVITKVTWTTPEPRGVGTTRVVYIRGGIIGDEEFLAWDPPTQMAFRFNRSSEKTVQAFAERYDVVRTPAGCRLTWTLALDVAGPSRFFMPLGKSVMNLTFRWFLKKLRRYTDEKYGARTPPDRAKSPNGVRYASCRRPEAHLTTRPSSEGTSGCSGACEGCAHGSRRRGRRAVRLSLPAADRAADGRRR